MDLISFNLFFEWDFFDVISIFLLILLFSWGLFTLWYKWSRKTQIPMWLEIFSLIFMFIILGIEIIKLREWLTNYPLVYLFSVLGLFVAVSALYSHSLVSAISSMVVNIVVPGEELAPDLPRFGPAEILEKQKDYLGALNEYLVLARIYPHNPSVHLRIVNVLEKMNKKEEALQWLEKSLKYIKKSEDVYLIVARYCDLASEVGKVDSAISLIDSSLSNYPDSVHAQSLVKRKKILTAGTPQQNKTSPLIKLEEQPILNQPDLTESSGSSDLSDSNNKKHAPSSKLEPL